MTNWLSAVTRWHLKYFIQFVYFEWIYKNQIMNTNDDDKANSDTFEEKYSNGNESEQLKNLQFNGVSDMLGSDEKRL